MANDTNEIRISAKLRRQLKVEIRALLISRAKIRGMIPYSKLADMITAVQIGPRARLLYDILDEISVEEHSAGRGMLSCIVVHKAGDMEPGVGFFELAERLGKKEGGNLKFWVKEMHEVHAAWEQPKNGGNLARQSPTREVSTALALQIPPLCPPSSMPARTRRRAARTSAPRRISG